MKPRPLPKFHQLAEALRWKITSGEWPPDQQLPIEDELCAQYGLSRGTVREAVRLLVDEGLLRREQGRGTFVNPRRAETTLFTLTSFGDELRRQNLLPATQILAAEVLPASREAAGRLELPPGEPVIHIARLRLGDGRPVALETRYLAQRLCPTLLEEDLTSESIHRLLVAKYHIPLVKMVHTVEIRRLPAEQALLLHAPQDSNAFFVDRLTYTEQGDRRFPAVWFQAFYRREMYHLEIEASTLTL